MRFGWLAAAVAVLGASQASAARYYEVEVTGNAIADLNTVNQALYFDRLHVAIDTATLPIGALAFDNEGYGPGSYSIDADYDASNFYIFTQNRPGGPNFFVSVPLSAIPNSNTLQSLPVTYASYSFRPCSSRACDSYPFNGYILSFLARTTDTAPAMLGISNGFSVLPIPEPATWATTILGMGAVGVALRRRRRASTGVRFA